MNFIFDNNISPYLARAVAALSEPYGHQVIHLQQRFPKDTPDIQWLSELAKEGGWAIISHDRFAKSSLEKEALRSSGIVTFILKKGWSNLKGWDKAWHLVRWWPRIIEQAEGVSNGAFMVPQRFSGKGKFDQVKL